MLLSTARRRATDEDHVREDLSTTLTSLRLPSELYLFLEPLYSGNYADIPHSNARLKVVHR